MRPYDDARYLTWQREFRQLIFEYMDTEGNKQATLENEFEEAVDEANENLEVG